MWQYLPVSKNHLKIYLTLRTPLKMVALNLEQEQHTKARFKVCFLFTLPWQKKTNVLIYVSPLHSGTLRSIPATHHTRWADRSQIPPLTAINHVLYASF